MAILFFGLRPKDFNRSNGVAWLKDRPGIQISKYGIAYAEVAGNAVHAQNESPAEFSIEMAFRPRSYQEAGFNLILSLHDGRDGGQLIVGQWQSSIVIMNGDDYDHTQRVPRAVVRAAASDPASLFLTIVADKKNTFVYADGSRLRTHRDFSLKYPAAGPTKLTLGNSIYGRAPWSGEIYGLAVYQHALSERQVRDHAASWSKTGRFSFAATENPFLLYRFDENEGDTVIDHGKGKSHLKIPSRMTVLKRQTLSLNLKDVKLSRGFVSDALINLAGFVPLGFVLGAGLMQSGRLTVKQCLLVALAGCFVLSLMIEIVQAWIPSRSSSMLDLILNSGGGLLGANLKGKGVGLKV